MLFLSVPRFLCLLIPLLLTAPSLWAADDIDLHQLRLTDAEQLLLSNNRELLLARRATEGSEADTLVAGQKPNPTLSIGVSSFNLNRGEGNSNPNGGSGLWKQTLNSNVQINQLFERGDKRNLRVAAAEKALQASRFDYEDTLRQQKLALRSAYYDLHLAQESEEVQQTNATLYAKTLQAAELRLQAGDISAADVARIRVDALRAKNDVRQAQASREKAQASLAYIIGKETEAANIVAIDAWPALSLADAADTMGAAKIDSRADIRAAEARTQAAEENRRLAEALKTRDITVGVQYQHFPGQEPGTGENTVGAAVTIPLFTNYQYQGEIARAQVDYDTALDAKEQTHAVALGEIAKARADLNAAIERVKRFDEEVLAEGQKAADAAEFAYQHGALGVTDLLDARRILRALQLDAATAHADFAKSLAAWQAATKTEDSP